MVVLLASLAVAELGLRLLPAGEAYIDTSLPRLRTARWPEADFRSRVYQPEKAPGTFRILVLGDSYTWGSGLHPEDAYPDRLERRLEDLTSDVEFEVINWSSPGWSTDLAWRSIRSRLAAWSPDLLILGFVINDAEIANLSETEREVLTPRLPESGFSGWLYRHSRAFSGIYDVFEYRRVRESLVDYYHGLFEDPEGWETCQRALRGLRKLARQHDIPFLVVVFPIFDSQLDDSYRYHELHELMAKTTQEMKIESLDLLPAYKGIDANRLALTPFTDPHPSELAQRIAADAILNDLMRRQWLPATRPEPPPPRQGAQANAR